MSPNESRAAALAAARDLLMEGGPQAVTLKAVAKKIGQTHANLSHHFGSAAGLQQELAGYLARAVQEELVGALRARLAGQGTVRNSVDVLFDVFDRGGGAMLCAWLKLSSGNTNFLLSLIDVVNGVVNAGAPDGTARPERRIMAFQLAIIALGDALLGESLTTVLGLPRDQAREEAQKLLERVLQLEAEETATQSA